MPTQVPPGSALAVKQVVGAPMRRRVKPRGPRMLKYAEGGIVGRVSSGIEAAGKLFGTARGKAIEAAERAVKGGAEKKEKFGTAIRRDLMKKVDDIEKGGG